MGTTEATYYGVYGTWLRNQIEQLSQGMTQVYSAPLNAGEVEQNWTVDGLELSDDRGLLRLHVPKGQSFGILFFNQKLSQDVIVDFSFMYPGDSAHDMNFVFPCAEKSVNAFNLGTVYVGSFCGWGGQLTGLEIDYPPSSSGKQKPARVLATGLVQPNPGVMHHATWGKNGDKQWMILDGQVCFFGDVVESVNGESGYFGFESFAGSILLGQVTIRTAQQTSV